jgi:hypothetical protein
MPRSSEITHVSRPYGRARARIPRSARGDPDISAPEQSEPAPRLQSARRRASALLVPVPARARPRSDAADCGAPSDARARCRRSQHAHARHRPWARVLERACACACAPTAARQRPPANVVRERSTDPADVRSGLRGLRSRPQTMVARAAAGAGVPCVDAVSGASRIAND